MDEQAKFEAWARKHHSMRNVDWFVDSDDLAGEMVDSWASWQAAVAAERERCANIVRDAVNWNSDATRGKIVAAIRERLS